MPNKTLIRSCGVALVALVAAVSSSNAEAGFQWISPQDGAAKNSVSVENRSVSAAASPQTIVPVVVNGSSASVEKYAVPSQANSQYSVQQQVHGMKAQNVALGDMAPASGREEVVQGFASNVPLSLALRQVLPTGRSFLIGPEVEVETLVSYRGGRSWRETLEEMLRPVGLAAYEQGNVVTIKPRGQMQAMNQMEPRPMRYQVRDMPRPDMQRAPMRESGHLVISGPGEPMNMNQPRWDNEPRWGMQQDSRRMPSEVMLPSESPRAGSLGFLTMPSERPMVGSDSIMDRRAGDWVAGRGETLRQVLEKWSSRAGFELKWIAEYDYPVEASVRFNGSFESAVRNLLSGFDGARPQPVGSLHNNSGAGQRVLVIQTRGNSYSD